MRSDPVPLADSHCHLDLDAFDDDRAVVIERARRHGVSLCVVPGVTAARWAGLRSLCDRHAGLHAALGLHPQFLAEHSDAHLEQLAGLLDEPDIVAVGECGLDYWHGRADATRQEHYLLAQLELARERDLPVILHARKALQDVTECLKRIGGLRGVVHSFSGSQQQAEQLWKLGFHLGIGGVVTYPRAQRLRRIVADMPAKWLLLETDSPDQPLCGYQGQRNEPARVREVLACVAALRGVDAAELAHQTVANTRRLFAIT